MNPAQQTSGGVDMQAIKEALMRRLGNPSVGQAPTTPTLGQTTPAAPGGATPQVQNPATPQPKFSSPFAGPSQQGQSQGLDDQTKQQVKALTVKLLQVL